MLQKWVKLLWGKLRLTASELERTFDGERPLTYWDKRSFRAFVLVFSAPFVRFLARSAFLERRMCTCLPRRRRSPSRVRCKAGRLSNPVVKEPKATWGVANRIGAAAAIVSADYPTLVSSCWYLTPDRSPNLRKDVDGRARMPFYRRFSLRRNFARCRKSTMQNGRSDLLLIRCAIQPGFRGNTYSVTRCVVQ